MDSSAAARAASGRQALRRARRGWPESFPLVQFPNAPLTIALGAWLVAALTDDSLHDYARAAFYAGLAAWAWGELAGGANWSGAR